MKKTILILLCGLVLLQAAVYPALAKEYADIVSGESKAFYEEKMHPNDPMKTPADYKKMRDMALPLGITDVEPPRAGFTITGPDGTQTRNNVKDNEIQDLPVPFIKAKSSADLKGFKITDTSQFDDSPDQWYDFQWFVYSPDEQPGNWFSLGKADATSTAFSNRWADIEASFTEGIKATKQLCDDSIAASKPKTYRLICYLAVSKGLMQGKNPITNEAQPFVMWSSNGCHMILDDRHPDDYPNGAFVYYVYAGVEMSASQGDLTVYGDSRTQYQKEYSVLRDWVMDDETTMWVQVNRFRIVYAFWNLSDKEMTGVPYRVVACRQGSETEGYVIKEGVVDLEPRGHTEDTVMEIDYDLWGLGPEYQNEPCVAVIIDPDDQIAEDREDNNIALFKPGDLKPALSVRAWSPPEGFPVHSTGYGIITVAREDTLQTEVEAVLTWRILDQPVQTKTLLIGPNKGDKDAVTVYHYSDVPALVPFNCELTWNDGTEMKREEAGACIRFNGDEEPWVPEESGYVDDMIIDIGSS